MTEEEFDDDAEPDLDDELEVEDLDEVLLVADDDAILEDDLETDLSVEIPVPVPVKEVAPEEEDEEEDDVLELDEELHPDDVEEPLDVLLQERTTSASLDEDEEDEEDDSEPDTSGDGSTKIVPRRPGEFLCSSCFLVLPRHQLADEQRSLCRDCV